MEDKESRGKKLEIIADDEVALGIYSNLALVNHSPDEFIMDFVYVPPNAPKARLRARIISSPSHMKRFLTAVQENVRKYEERFGTIEAGSPQARDLEEGAGHA